MEVLKSQHFFFYVKEKCSDVVRSRGEFVSQVTGDLGGLGKQIKENKNAQTDRNGLRIFVVEK